MTHPPTPGRPGDEEQALNPDSPAKQPTPWLKPADAAIYLGVALGTLRNWTSMRYVPHAKRRGVVRYHRDVLDRWLAQTSRPGRNTKPN